ncbi:MAG: YceI family protein [Candidatus Dormibacteraeota bacterium]|nr:YceI family protein [Candidatus Dormibacteraeota bacterium]
MPDRWIIDTNHSVIGFSAKHMMFTTVRGRFTDYEGLAEIEGEDYKTAHGELTAKTASVDTGVADRDAHLRSADFFDADNYPEMKFVSTNIEKTGDNLYRITGDLTIKDVTGPITVDAEAGPKINDPWGNERIALAVSGKLNRKDWGLNWNMALEAGGFLVSETVNLEVEATFVHPLAVPTEADSKEAASAAQAAR